MILARLQNVILLPLTKLFFKISLDIPNEGMLKIRGIWLTMYSEIRKITQKIIDE